MGFEHTSKSIDQKDFIDEHPNKLPKSNQKSINFVIDNSYIWNNLSFATINGLVDMMEQRIKAINVASD